MSRLTDKPLSLPQEVTRLHRRVLHLEKRSSYAGAGDGGGGGETQVLAYVHNQGSSSSVWTINHPLTFAPNVAVVDSAGEQVEGEVDYLGAGTIRITFSAAFSGTAYLS